MDDEEVEQRDAELVVPQDDNDNDDDKHERVGLFQFGEEASLADETRELRHRVGGLNSDSEADMSDASVGSLGMRMEMAFREDGKYESRKRKRSTAPKRKAPKRPRPEPAAAEADGVREELKAMPLDFGALAGAVDDDEPEPMSADVVDWDDVDSAETERNPDPDWCFLCKHTQRVIDIGVNNPYLGDLKKHAEDNWVHVEHKELMRQLQGMYEKDLRWSIDDVSQRLPWHKKTIFAHFTRHTKETRVKYEAESAACDEMIYIMMQEELFVKNKKTGRKNVNLKKLPQWFKLLAQQEKFEKTLKAMRPAQRVL